MNPVQIVQERLLLGVHLPARRRAPGGSGPLVRCVFEQGDYSSGYEDFTTSPYGEYNHGHGRLFNIPFYGYTNATFLVVQALVERGEDITYYLTEFFREQVEHPGCASSST